ncbi:hypothetical protein EDC04DRAFT_3150915 [Pisolithus marmoratus]|nr:hypothetical protein EDC04DRAFT_3150915 [Pisolithus marmoratus]
MLLQAPHFHARPPVSSLYPSIRPHLPASPNMLASVPSFQNLSDGASYTDSWYSRQTVYATTDFESITWKHKPITGPEFFDRSLLSRRIALSGIFVTILFGIACIVGAAKIFVSKNTISVGVVVLSFKHEWQREGISLGLNLLVAVCTEATGFVHNITLRAALASESRLRFNTNLRLVSAAKGIFNPNGTVCNVVMAILLIISKCRAIKLGDLRERRTVNRTWTSLLLQAFIAIAGVWSADVLTWSSSPFDITAALVHHAQVVPVPGRCMRGVDAQNQNGPAQPRKQQPSAWVARRSVRKVVILLWVLAIACLGWGLVVVHLIGGNMSGAISSWSFFPDFAVVREGIQHPTPHWACMVLLELVTNVIRDENAWRRATGKNGARLSTNPLAVILGSPLNVALLCAKPLLRESLVSSEMHSFSSPAVDWMLGLAINLAGTATSDLLTAVAVSMFPVQILNLTGALFLLAFIFTIVAIVRRSGPQPAAYGHIQTLANLIDEWSPVMWWGHKTSGRPYHHAGTNSRPLEEVKMYEWYA